MAAVLLTGAGCPLAAKRAGSTAVQRYVQKLAEVLTVGRRREDRRGGVRRLQRRLDELRPR